MKLNGHSNVPLNMPPAMRTNWLRKHGLPTGWALLTAGELTAMEQAMRQGDQQVKMQHILISRLNRDQRRWLQYAHMLQAGLRDAVNGSFDKSLLDLVLPPLPAEANATKQPQFVFRVGEKYVYDLEVDNNQLLYELTEDRTKADVLSLLAVEGVRPYLEKHVAQFVLELYDQVAQKPETPGSTAG